jgi:hypothetical protein
VCWQGRGGWEVRGPVEFGEGFGRRGAREGMTWRSSRCARGSVCRGRGGGLRGVSTRGQGFTAVAVASPLFLCTCFSDHQRPLQHSCSSPVSLPSPTHPHCHPPTHTNRW